MGAGSRLVADEAKLPDFMLLSHFAAQGSCYSLPKHLLIAARTLSAWTTSRGERDRLASASPDDHVKPCCQVRPKAPYGTTVVYAPSQPRF